jgi:hypothetical protein
VLPDQIGQGNRQGHVPLQASPSQLGELQSPSAHEKTQLEPSRQSALGHTEPAPLHVKVQAAPLGQVTASPLQSLPPLQLKPQASPTPQVTLPLQ